ncbi:MAG: LTA synthase family protein [Clostridiales bacterium]|nr:LTA synthase family protein [Clostridiales bacterium]
MKEGKRDMGGEDKNRNTGIDLFRFKVAEIVNKAQTLLKEYWDYSDKKKRDNLLVPLCFFIGSLIYLELIIHLLLFKGLDNKIIYPILFAIPLGFLFTILTGFFNSNINKRIMWGITGAICLVFGIQLIYYYVFKVFFSFQSIGMAGDAFSEFGSDISTAVKENISELILLFLPLPVLAILFNQNTIGIKRELKEQGLLGCGMLFVHILVLLSLSIYGKGDFTPHDLYYKSQVHDLCGKQLGIATMTRLDLGNLLDREEDLVLADSPAVQWNVPTLAPTPVPSLKPNPVDQASSPTPSPLPTPTPIDTSPNVMDIDFEALAKQEKDNTIRTLHEYFASVKPTNKNKYTGMFKGYNLIMITAEGFSPYAVHKELTPTLYRLTNEGFVFNNFYTALWQTSTSDGEYVAMTGLIPVGTRSMYRTRNNYMPFALGHQFNKLGVESKAYHNHTYTYYQRNETHPNLGYKFKAKGNGLILESDVWPESDLEMINATVDEYIGEDQFHVYYLTVSGHMNYTFVGNSMSFKNRNLVADLPYSSEAKAYLACQIELDRALEQLIKALEKAGVADKTVIALSADHYPYGWEKDKLDELAGYEVEENFEIFKNHFILWNSGMKEKIIVDEPCSSLDILPTLSNLFGLEYDSRLLMGQDIFSDAPPLVILSDRSFITDKVKYNSETREVIKLTEEELPKDYIKILNNIIKNKFNVSKSIVDEDYYRHVFFD